MKMPEYTKRKIQRLCESHIADTQNWAEQLKEAPGYKGIWISEAKTEK